MMLRGDVDVGTTRGGDNIGVSTAVKSRDVIDNVVLYYVVADFGTSVAFHFFFMIPFLIR